MGLTPEQTAACVKELQKEFDKRLDEYKNMVHPRLGILNRACDLVADYWYGPWRSPEEKGLFRLNPIHATDLEEHIKRLIQRANGVESAHKQIHGLEKLIEKYEGKLDDLELKHQNAEWLLKLYILWINRLRERVPVLEEDFIDACPVDNPNPFNLEIEGPVEEWSTVKDDNDRLRKALKKVEAYLIISMASPHSQDNIEIHKIVSEALQNDMA